MIFSLLSTFIPLFSNLFTVCFVWGIKLSGIVTGEATKLKFEKSPRHQRRHHTHLYRQLLPAVAAGTAAANSSTTTNTLSLGVIGSHSSKSSSNRSPPFRNK
jgi:hypothetical protein